MVKSAIMGFLKEVSNKIASYTKYVHAAVYGSVWALFVLLFSLGDFSIYVPLVLGGIVNLLIGFLFWFLPALLVRRKRRTGKNWNPLLSVVNLGLLQYVVLPCWSIFFFVVIASSFFGSSNGDADSPSLLVNSSAVAQKRKAFEKPLAWGAESAFEKVRFQRLQVAAKNGEPKAQTDLGRAYSKGEGTSQDYDEALKWYTLAADQGYARAQYNVGYYYAEGKGTPQDYNEAIKWYTLAADQGHAWAQFNLGHMYSNGEGVPKDYAEAIKWYNLAADQGDAWAQYSIALLYANGNGVPQDYNEAIKWYNLAADQGYAWAQFNLAQIYYNSKGGVPQDYDEAFRLYAIVAEQGDADAQYGVGRGYLLGHGTDFDFDLGLMYCKLAFDGGSTSPVKEVLEDFEGKLKPQKIRKIQKMARSWRIEHGK